ncbi:hypothetical protein P692DRAFT_20758941, partial [Suillus brevipes Sb2]
MSIPRPNNANAWAWFTLAHFKPFSIDTLLLPGDASVEEVFSVFKFSDRANTIMKNWEAVHECEDQRDAERLLKQARVIGSTTANSDTSSAPVSVDSEVDITGVTGTTKRDSREQFHISQFILLLKQSRWLNKTLTMTAESRDSFPSTTFQDQDIQTHLKTWKIEIKKQETRVADLRWNALNP